MLSPVSVPVDEALGAVTSTGFSPNGIPADISADPVTEPAGGTNFADSDAADTVAGSEPGTEGGTTATTGVNGSRARLPYGLDPVPGGRAGQLAFGRAAARGDALRVVPIAARPRATTPGRCWWCRPPAGSIRARYRCSGPPTSRPPRTEPGGAVAFGDVGAAPAWRNLRAPLSAIPRERHPDPARRHRRRPGPPALDGGDPAAHPAAAHAAGRRRIARPGDAGLAGRPGVPVPAPVRASTTASSRHRSGGSCRTVSAPRPTHR